MTYDTDNIFAKIIRGDIPCDKVFEDEYVLAFKDIAPQAPVHILVIPKASYKDLSDFSAHGSSEEITAFHRAVAHIVQDYKMHENGFRAIANSGADGGQEVPHYHLHLLAGKKIGPMVSP